MILLSGRKSFPSAPASFPATSEVRPKGKMGFPAGQAFGIEGKMIGERWLKKGEGSAQTERRYPEIRASDPRGGDGTAVVEISPVQGELCSG